MSKTTVADWSTTASSNTDVGGISIAEGMLPSAVNNAMREMMAQIKAGVPYLSSTSVVMPGSTAALVADADDGATLGTTAVQWSDLFLASGGVINWANGDVTITHSSNLLAFAGASSGYTFDVPIGVASGGTGSSSLTANNVLLGNGTSALQVVAPGTSGNVLTSNGTTWASTAPPAIGGLTLLGTLTTTSGTTQSLTGIAAGYNQFYIEIEGVSNNSSSATTLQLLLGSGSTSYGAAGSVSASLSSATAVLAGFIIVGNISSTTAAAKSALASVMIDGALAIPTSVPTPTGTAAVTTAVRFSWSSGASFDAGTIRVYGVK